MTRSNVRLLLITTTMLRRSSGAIRDRLIEDGLNRVSMRGRAELRERYTAFFAAAPSLRVEIRSRIRVGYYVIDEE
jgi:hypothetical protein